MSKRIYLVYNPVAGRGLLTERIGEITEIFSREGYETIVRATTAKGDAAMLAETADLSGCDYFVSCGGDGTLDETVSGIMRRIKAPDRENGPDPGSAEGTRGRSDGRNIVVGYIPAGSTNDFAVSLRIPPDPAAAARTVIRGRTYFCDIGGFNENSYFVYVAAFGLFTEVSYSTPQEMKNLLGHTAYLINGIGEMMKLGKMKPHHIRAEYDGKTIEDDYAVGLVTNARSVGGFAQLAGGNVDLSDGLFEVTLIKMPRDVAEATAILGGLINSDYSTSLMVHFQTESLKITSDSELKWTLDGEFGGEHKEAVLTNLNRVLRIRVPEE